MCLFEKSSKKHLASERLAGQVWGALLKRWWLVAVMLILVLVPWLLPDAIGDIRMLVHKPWYLLLLLTLFVWLAISMCRTLTNIFNLRKKEAGITWCQILILFAVGTWFLGFLVIANIQKDSRYYLAIGIAGSMLAWVFQDTIKGVVAFIHLRQRHLLCIDDWIQVPKYNVDGEVKRVTLTTVTVCNWDTTISSVPTSALHADSFINLQKMVEGKTYGRQMSKSFILDTSRFHPLSAIEVEQLKALHRVDERLWCLPEDEIKEGVLNATLYRTYLFHWLMNHPYVSQQPFLLVRWKDQIEFGLPMEVCAFITDGNISSFEWQQSLIVEHVVESLDWFGLQLYQKKTYKKEAVQ